MLHALWPEASIAVAELADEIPSDPEEIFCTRLRFSRIRTPESVGTGVLSSAGVSDWRMTGVKSPPSSVRGGADGWANTVAMVVTEPRF